MNVIHLLIRFFLFVSLIPFVSFSARLAVDGLMLGRLVHETKIENLSIVFCGAILDSLLLLIPNAAFFLLIIAFSFIIGSLAWEKVIIWATLPSCIVGFWYFCAEGGLGKSISIGIIVGTFLAAFMQYCIELYFKAASMNLDGMKGDRNPDLFDSRKASD